MPRQKRPKPIYQRGPYRLIRRPDRPALQIVWYDAERRRERGVSAGTADDREGVAAVDRLYLEAHGVRTCPTCHRPFDGAGPQLVTAAIADYLVLSEGKAGAASAGARLGMIVDYLDATDPELSCTQVTERWAGQFRAWGLAQRIVTPKGRDRGARSPAYVEGALMQLAAAITATQPIPAAFRPRPMAEVARSPTYRADVPTMAAMFRHALADTGRVNLLRFLRAAVATWARPDAIYDIHSDQWVGEARALALNPPARRQTKKRRPVVPVPAAFAAHLDALAGRYIPVASIRGTWDKMRAELDLPPGADGGTKLIRRSMATIARRRLGEANWIQGRMMLGHVAATTSDIYALPDPAHLGTALAVTESIMAEIEALAPGAFSLDHRNLTAPVASLRVVNGGLSD